jgi:hypothetical protein
MFLYSTVSTLKPVTRALEQEKQGEKEDVPIVGMVVTISPSLSL